MKAPEKIFLRPNHKGEVGASWLTFSLINEDIKYVRADAFMEKAIQFIEERLVFEDKQWHKDGDITVKDKMIEEFKNYLKK